MKDYIFSGDWVKHGALFYLSLSNQVNLPGWKRSICLEACSTSPLSALHTSHTSNLQVSLTGCFWHYKIAFVDQFFKALPLNRKYFFLKWNFISKSRKTHLVLSFQLIFYNIKMNRCLTCQSPLNNNNNKSGRHYKICSLHLRNISMGAKGLAAFIC